MATEQRSRWLDWISLLLLLAILIVLSYRLAATGWVADLIKIQNILSLACILGAWIGFSRFSWRLALTVGVIYGLIAILWLIGSIFPPAGPWLERLIHVTVRLGVTWEQIQAGHPAGDPILFYVLAAILIWTLAFGGAFLMVRKGVIWPYLVPGMILFLTIDRFDLFYRNRSVLYVAYSLLAIIAIGRMYLLHRRSSWSGMGSENAAKAEMDLTRITVILTLALVISISLLPGAGTPYNPAERAWENTSQAWGKIRRQLANLFAPLKSSSSFGEGYYSDELPLGTNANQSEAPALEITTDALNPENDRFFWRVRTYDHYSNGTWTSSAQALSATDIPTNTLPKPAWFNREEQSFTVTVRMDDLGMLYTEQDPHETSVPVESFVYTENRIFLDVDRLESNSTLGYGERYQFRSDLARPGSIQLIEAEPVDLDSFPPMYLQIPENLPPRVVELAKQITADKSTPFEKTQAITAYLRSQIQYRVSVDPTPPGHEPVDYFLFDSRAGFCNYYASAAVILLRSIGIPSRLVVGFSEGELDVTSGVYTVRMVDSHAWPEVFFQGYGWIPFEPTTIQAEYALPQNRDTQPVQPEDEVETSVASTGRDAIPTPSDPRSRNVAKDEDPGVTESHQPVTRPMFWVFPAILLILALMYWMLYSTTILVGIAQLLTLFQIPIRGITPWIQQLNLGSRYDRALLLPELALVLGGLNSDPFQTPSERFTHWQKIFPNIKDDVNIFANNYEKVIFGSANREDHDIMAVSKKIYRHMLPKMVFRRLRMKW